MGRPMLRIEVSEVMGDHKHSNQGTPSKTSNFKSRVVVSWKAILAWYSQLDYVDTETEMYIYLV